MTLYKIHFTVLDFTIRTLLMYVSSSVFEIRAIISLSEIALGLVMRNTVLLILVVFLPRKGTT